MSYLSMGPEMFIAPTMTAVHLTPMAQDGCTAMATATGTVVVGRDVHGFTSTWLLTNWHVLTGRNPFSGEWLSPWRAYPRFCDVRLRDRHDAERCVRLD